MTLKESPISEVLLLNAVTTALSQYIAETNPDVLFNGLLETLLELTGSEYGFIGEVFYSDDNKPYIKSYATTDIAWNAQTRKLYDEVKQRGMLFSKFDSLYGSVLKTGQPVISNRPDNDPRRCGLPQGHPPLNAFIGIPFYGGGELLGMVGIANREQGYSRALIDRLQPFLTTCGHLIQAYRNNLKHQRIEDELQNYRARLTELDEPVVLGHGYTFFPAQRALKKAEVPLVLTRQELVLLEQLVSKCNRVVHYQEIEAQIWKNVIVSDASLRSLMRRLRKKLPELPIQTVSGVGYLLVLPC
ncbi:MAG: GAF domain-containing protein [Gammaproteobacteria bacterium]|nr:GAF domain-containing protein [Gammaproteobacteria bacterium]